MALEEPSQAELDEALILFWRLLHLSPPSMFLEDSDLAFKTLSKFPDILALSDDDTVHPVMSQNQVYRMKRSRGNSRSELELHQKDKTKLFKAIADIEESLARSWTFTYPVPRDIFLALVATYDMVKALPPNIGPRSRFGRSLCVLMPSLKVEGPLVSHLSPAPRSTGFSPPGTLEDPRDFFYDFISLMGYRYISVDMLMEVCRSSADLLSRTFSSPREISEFLEYHMPDEFELHDGYLEVIIREPTGVMKEERLEVPLKVQVPNLRLNQEVCKDEEAAWEPSTPLELLAFFDARSRVTNTRSGYSEGKGLQIQTFLKQLGRFVSAKAGQEKLLENFVRSYEGFVVEDDYVFSANPQCILSPWNKLFTLTLVEDICRKIREMAGLSTTVRGSLFKIPCRSVIAPLPSGWRKRQKTPAPAPVPEDAPRLPREELLNCIMRLPDKDQEFLRDLFPGLSILRHLPLLSTIIAFPLIITEGAWVLA